ncbi:MAG TPA: fibronectin type III domain-containing protein [Coxiellaceae bacterium]|nr:fibronectin type III domain-containing protein [Coxiellaceae bacterium]
MKNKIVNLFLVIFASLFFVGVSFAGTQPNPGYIQFSFPASSANPPVSQVYVNQNGTPNLINLSYPVYFYKQSPPNDAMYQISYYGALGDNNNVVPQIPYENNSPMYYVFFQNNNPGANGTWYYYQVQIVNGQVVSNMQPPQSFTLTPPSSSNANLYTLGYGASVFQPATGNLLPGGPRSFVPAPQRPRVDNVRNITFVNNTNFPVIQIYETCASSSNGSPANDDLCMQGPIFEIKKGESAKFPDDLTAATVNANGGNVPKNWNANGTDAQKELNSVSTSTVRGGGLISANFKISAYKTSVNGPWISVSSGAPYATLFEATLFPYVLDGSGNFLSVLPSNVDVSAVDGFDFGIKVYPTTVFGNSAICEQNNWGDSYDSKNPLSEMGGSAQSPLDVLCVQSSAGTLVPPSQASTLPPDVANLLNLYKTNSSNGFNGCLSPCNYASRVLSTYAQNDSSPYQTVAQNTINSFCGTPAPDSAPASAASIYVSNMAAYTKHVYSYDYDDSNGDYGCDAMASYTVEFFSPSSAYNNTLTAPQNVTVAAQSTQATVTWDQSTDPNSTSITYPVQVTNLTSTPQQVIPVADIGPVELSGQQASVIVSNLTPNTAYQVSVSAQDTVQNNGASVIQLSPAQPPVNFVTQATPDTITQPVITQPINAGTTSAPISWSTSTDSLGNPVTYEVNITPTPNGYTPTPLSNTSTTLNNLTQNTPYTVTVTATDGTASSTSAPVNFTTQAIPDTITQPVVAQPINAGTTSAPISWSTSTDSLGNPVTYEVNITPTPNGYTPTPLSNTSTTLNNLTQNTPYTVTVTATDGTASSTSAPVNFTTQAAPPSYKTFTLYHDRIHKSIVLWKPVSGETEGDFVSATATPVGGVASISGTQVWLLPRQNEAQATFNGLTPGQQYNVVVTLDVNGQIYKGFKTITP